MRIKKYEHCEGEEKYENISVFPVFFFFAHLHIFRLYALSKLAISLSLKSDEPMVESDFKTDNNGLELNRQTITGEYDELYKCLIAMKENRHIDDDEYFQKYIKAHLDRGAKYLYAEFRYGGDFITHLLSAEKGI